MIPESKYSETDHGYLRIDLHRLALEVALADLVLALTYAAGGSYLFRAFWSTVIPTRVLTGGRPLGGRTRAVGTRAAEMLSMTC